MVASPRHADAGWSVTAAPEQLPRAAAAPRRRRDKVDAGSQRSEEVARKRAAPASGRVAAAEEEGRRRRLWQSVEAAALYIVAALRRSASDKGCLPLPEERKGCFGGKGKRQPRARRSASRGTPGGQVGRRRGVLAGGLSTLRERVSVLRRLAWHHVMVMVTELSMEAERQSSSDRVQAQ